MLLIRVHAHIYLNILRHRSASITHTPTFAICPSSINKLLHVSSKVYIPQTQRLISFTLAYEQHSITNTHCTLHHIFQWLVAQSVRKIF